METKVTPELLKTKKHFEILDGMRGLAALGVVLYHFIEWVFSDYSKNFVGHGHLAVDFFFCLSGFVIAYAYDNRIGRMGFKEFFKSRLIRLHPLVVFGSVLGLIAFYADPYSDHMNNYSTGQVMLIFLLSILLIPYGAMEERYHNLFSFNAPSWSLFWEYVANIFYALILFRISRKWLTILLVPAAAGIVFVSYSAGNLMGGWGSANFWHGFARIAYSFLAGMLVYRSNWIIKNRIGFFGLGAMLVATFVMPLWSINWILEALIVIFYFPFLIALGAGCSVSGVTKKVCNLSGNISYPLYMTHYMVMWIFHNYYRVENPGTTELVWVIGGGTVLLILFAYLVMVLYDIPVRKYLMRNRKHVPAERIAAKEAALEPTKRG